jgi:hypothetical protein
MNPTAIALPEPLASDSEAVVTALESAEIFHSRADLVEAVRWLRRAADLASEAGDDARALGIARVAAELSPNPSGPTPSDGGGEAAPRNAASDADVSPQRRAQIDDIMAELFDQPLAPAIRSKTTPSANPAEPTTPPPRKAPPPLPPDPRPPTFGRTWADEMNASNAAPNVFPTSPSAETSAIEPPAPATRFGATEASVLRPPPPIAEPSRRTEIWETHGMDSDAATSASGTALETKASSSNGATAVGEPAPFEPVAVEPAVVFAPEEATIQPEQAPAGPLQTLEAESPLVPSAPSLVTSPAAVTSPALVTSSVITSATLGAPRQPSLSSLDVDWDTVDSSEAELVDETPLPVGKVHAAVWDVEDAPEAPASARAASGTHDAAIAADSNAAQKPADSPVESQQQPDEVAAQPGNDGAELGLAALSALGALRANLWPTTEGDVFVMIPIRDPEAPSEDALEAFVILTDPSAGLA